MRAKSCEASTGMRFELDRVIEALIFAALFFLPWHNEALLRNSFSAETPYGRILFEIAFALWAVQKVAWRERIRLPGTFWWFAAFLGWSWNRLLVMPNAGPAAPGAWWLLAESALLFLFASDFYRDESRRRRLTRFFLLWMGVVCASGVWQMLSAGGRDFLVGRPADVPGRLVRMSGPFGSPNGLAAFLLLALPLSMGRWFSSKLSAASVAWMALTALFAVCLTATLSRGAFAALWATLFAYALLRKKGGLATAVLVLPAALFLSPHLRQNFLLSLSAADITLGYRLKAWAAAWQTLIQNPWGAGFGALTEKLAPLTPDSARFVPAAHNSYLQIAAELGWPGLFLFAATVVLVFRAGKVRTSAVPGLRLALAALAVHAALDADFARFKILSLFWLFSGVSQACAAEPDAALVPRAVPCVWTRFVFTISGLAGLAWAVTLPFARPPLQNFLFGVFPYWILLVLAGVAVWTAARIITANGVLAAAPALLGSLFAAALVFGAVRPDLRVITDESEMLMVSRSMAERGETFFAPEGVVRGGAFSPMTIRYEIRPYLFPFLTHALHRVAGYGPQNAFAVNFLVLAGCIFSVYTLGVRMAGSRWWGVAAVAALLSQPILLLSAASAGFEALQLLLVLASFGATRHFLERPQDEKRFRLLWISFLLLAQVRYESLFFGIAVIGVLAACHRVPAAHFSKSWIYAATPALLLPWVWQRILFSSYFPPSLAPGTTLYSGQAFVEHLLYFFRTLGDFRRYLPYNPVVSALGIAGAAVCARRLWTGSGRRQENLKVLTIAFALPLLVISGGLCAYAESGLWLPQSARYFVLGGSALALLAVALLYFILGRRGGRIALAFLLVTLFFFLPPAVRPAHWEENAAHFEYRFARRVKESQAHAGKVLWVVRRPFVYTALGESALFYPTFERNYRQWPRLFHGYRILAIQQEDSQGRVTEDTLLPAGVPIQVLARIEWRPGIWFRIVELSRLRPGEKP